MSAVRVGVVGFGGFGRLHAKTLAGIAEAKLAAIVDRSGAAMARARDEHPAVPFYADLDQALRESDVEAWVIATHTDSHIPIARTLLQAGKAVLIEKPMAPDLAAAKSLEPLVAADSRNVMLGHLALFVPEFQHLLAEIRERGGLRYFHAIRHRGGDHFDYFPNETPLQVTMVHDLYLAYVLTGGEEPARMAARLHRRSDGRVDLALAEFEWPSGVWGSFTASFLTPPGMPKDGFDQLEVFGEGWAARVRANPRPIELWADRALWPMSLDIQSGPQASGWLAEELRCFCRVVGGQQPVPLGARYADGVRLQEWLERLEASARR
jgi:predicted dehydrogenase